MLMNEMNPFISVDLILKGAAAPLASEALLFIHI